MRPGAFGQLRNLLWLKARVTANSYRRLLRRPRGRLTLAGLLIAFLFEILVFWSLVQAVRVLQGNGFVTPGEFEWTTAALLPLYVLLLMPTAAGVELQTQIDARKVLPYPLRMREVFLGAAVGRAYGLFVPIPFVLPPLIAAWLLAPPSAAGAPFVVLALALSVLQAIFLSQIITVSFQASLSSRRLRDTLAFASVFLIMFAWAALQLWVFGNLGSREALLARVSEGNMPPVLAGRVLGDPLGTRGVEALGFLALETVGTFIVGVLVSHFFFVMRVPSKAAARTERPVAIPRLPLSDHGNLLLWKDRIYLRRDPFVKAASYGTLVLVLVALVASSSTRLSDPRVAGGFFLAMFSFLAPWTFLSGLGANVLGVEDGLPFLLSTPFDRRAFLRSKSLFLVGLSTGVSALTLSACAVLFDRVDLLPTAVAFAFLISVGLTAAAMISSAYFPTQAVREGFRRKTVSGLGLATFSLLGLLFLVPVGIAGGLPTLFGNRTLLLLTVPAALAVEYAFLRTSVELALEKIGRDEGEVLLRVRG